MTAKKDTRPRTYRDLKRRVESWGWTVTHARSGHYHVRDGAVLVTVLPDSSSDWRGARNAWTHITRYRQRKAAA